MIQKKSSSLIAIISASVLWGFFAFPLKALKTYTSEQILTWRIVIALLIVWLIIGLFKTSILKQNIATVLAKRKKERNKILLLIFISGILLTLNWFTYIYTVNHISLKSGAFAYLICPLITTLAAYLILKEPLNKLQFIALAIVILCIVGLATGSLTEILWSVFIAGLYAFFLIIQRVIIEIDKVVMLGFQLVISFVLLLPFLWYFPQHIPTEVNFWINVSFISIFLTIIPLLLSLYALAGLPSSIVGITIYINPLISFSVALLFFNEIIKAEEIIYYILLLLAVLLFNRDMLLSLINPKSVKS